MPRIAHCLFAALLAAALALPSPSKAQGMDIVFETPSGNIECTMVFRANASYIVCTIVQRNPGPTALPRPADCTGYWGHSFTMLDTGPASLRCEPTPPRDTWIEGKLNYGETAPYRGLTCTSTASGLQCVNTDGHGFFLSRARQAVF
ncbi:MAG: hypothetical protein CMH12_20615 [Maritimibacter sp.]|nr:hypothetical protein [Maritimibacter sp.]